MQQFTYQISQDGTDTNLLEVRVPFTAENRSKIEKMVQAEAWNGSYTVEDIQELTGEAHV